MRFYVFLISILVALDQFIKYLVRINLSSYSYIEIIPNLVHLTYQENQGISFSMLSDLPDSIRVPLLSGVSGVVVIGLCIYIYRGWNNLNTGEKWGFSLIISGAIGNLLDRAIRQQVTDYMFFHFYETGFFVNNLADDIISIGFVLILWQSFFKKTLSDEK